MDSDEQQMLASAEQLLHAYEAKANAYEAKAKQLRALINTWKETSVGLDNLMAGVSTEAKPVLESARQWLRFAIEQGRDSVTVPKLLKYVRAAEPSKEISTAQVSAFVYDLLKAGELETVAKSPGKPSVYRATQSFKPVKRYPR